MVVRAGGREVPPCLYHLAEHPGREWTSYSRFGESQRSTVVTSIRLRAA